ncbi:hypothetical protein GYMLUDRAFT_225067, partial [Collybiopsis luxurians FD-317 M1]
GDKADRVGASSQSGNESQAAVELTPYRNVPQHREKLDQRKGIIERYFDYENYISFIEPLTRAGPEPVSF